VKGIAPPWIKHKLLNAIVSMPSELEADGLVDRLRAEAETAVAKLQSDANARVERTKRLNHR
jgi:hypothetical protein